MNVQAISFTNKQHYPQFKNQASLQKTTDVVALQAPNMQPASFQEVASLNIQADNIQKSAKSVKNAAKFAYDEARSFLWDAAQYQNQAREIFAKIQEKIDELECEGKDILQYKSVIMNLSNKDKLLEIVLKDGKAIVYSAESSSWSSFDKYEIDLKTGELLTFKKAYKPYKNDVALETGYTYVADVMASQYSASEEYAFVNGDLVTCDLGVANKDYKKSDKRFTFSNGELIGVMFGVKETSGPNAKVSAERRFSFLKEDKLMAYYRNYELQSRLRARSADIVYEFNNGEDLGAFTRGYSQNSINSWSCKEVFKFSQKQIKEVVFGEKKNVYGSSFQKRYNFIDGEVFIERS